MKAVETEVDVLPSDAYMKEQGYQPVQTEMYTEDQPQQNYIAQQQQQQQEEFFGRPSELKVIQEYNREEMLTDEVKVKFWGLLSKSIKLGFWEKEDEQDLFYHKNLIKVGHIMSMPKHTYTFKERQQMNMIDLLTYADFKRGVGMEKYRINERTLQATSVTQNIQGGSSGGKRGGILAGIKSFFG